MRSTLLFIPSGLAHQNDMKSLFYRANWIQLDQENRWADSAGFFGWGSPTTWTYGTYEWAIEVRWRVVGKETGQGEVLGNRVQTHTLNDGTGSSTELKLNNTATRTP